jgi:hypothetical protein
MLPHYWSELVLLADQLLQTEEEREDLKQLIFEVEKLVLETEMVPVEDEESGKLMWVERVKGDRSLYDVEMAIESNPDFYAYFEKEDGSIVTKFDIERRLDKLRKWLYEIVRQKAVGRRFQKFR